MGSVKDGGGRSENELNERKMISYITGQKVLNFWFFILLREYVWVCMLYDYAVDIYVDL